MIGAEGLHMNKGLVVVESPNKVKKIQKYVNSILGQGFRVVASVGHFRDLPERGYGVAAPDYVPEYVVDPKKKGVVAKLKSAAKNADVVYLATDLDREGEAIAWHVTQVLGKSKSYRRIVFNEITESAVREAFENWRGVDMGLVDAQQSRRVVDRLVGYRVGTALRNRESESLTAGRVQSVAVKLVAMKCDEVANFVDKPYLSVWIEMQNAGAVFKARLVTKKLVDDGELFNDRTVADAAAGVTSVNVDSVSQKNVDVKPQPPLITSTLQQLGSNRLRVSTAKIMQIAQKLFEQGHITYHRTDFPNLSTEAVSEIRELAQSCGYPLPDTVRKFKSKGDAQEAHEAIRPTDFSVLQEDLDYQGEDVVLAQKIYGLIRFRAIASQLSNGIDSVTDVILSGNGSDGKSYQYSAAGRVVVSQGWRVLKSEIEDAETGSADEQRLPALEQGVELTVEDSGVENKKTTPPPLYTEANLVKKLEKEGVGRPSTYADIIKKILGYGYIEAEKRRFVVTQRGMLLVQCLDGAFEFMDVGYTREIETQFDRIAANEESYLNVVREVDDLLLTEIDKFGASTRVSNAPVHKCGKCDANLRRLKGKRGYFWGCTRFSEGCDFTVPDVKGSPGEPGAYQPAKTSGGKDCPECSDGKMVKRKGSKGDFYGCSNYPNCRHTAPVGNRSRKKA